MPRTSRTVVWTLLVLLLQWIALAPASAEDQLVLSVTLIRHGDRNPYKGMPGCPYPWKLGLGELTPLGMRQEYQLGQSLRERYVNQFHLLPSTYEPGTIQARSTSVNRTIMSAQCLLFGLYPPHTAPTLDDGSQAVPGGFQPIPIRTKTPTEDRVLLGGRFHGQEVRSLRERLVFTTQAWLDKTKAHGGRFSRWSRISGIDIRTLSDLVPMADDLNVRLVHKATLPAGLTAAEAREIVDLGFWTMAREYRPREVGRLIAGDLLAELATTLEKAQQGTLGYRFVLWSAHDSTLLPLLSALGIPRETQVPYASNVSFELLRNGSTYAVRVRFNGDDVVLPDTGKSVSAYPEFKQKVLQLTQ